MQKAHEVGVVNDARVLRYTPASPEMSYEQLRAWWASDYSSVCGVCVEEWKQVPVEEKFWQVEL
jgi:hypothetical protein